MPQWMLYAAWAYVVVRVIHSLCQVTTNKVMVRFPLFALGSFILMVMAAYAAGHAIGFGVGTAL